MKVRKHLVRDIVRSINTLLKKLRETSEWFDLVIQDLANQSFYVNSAKTFNASVAVVSSVLLFCGPLAPFGVGGLAFSGVAGGATAVGDYVATNHKAKLSKDKFKEIQMEEKKLVELLEELQKASNEISKKHKVNQETALVLIVRHLVPMASAASATTSATVDIAKYANNYTFYSRFYRLGARKGVNAEIASNGFLSNMLGAIHKVRTQNFANF